MNDLLNLILDTLIPASEDGRMPSAGSLGLADTIWEQTVDVREGVEAGLHAVQTAGFEELDLEGRVDLLRQMGSTHPAFVESLYVPTCTAYYQHPKVMLALGLEGRPPYPKGYDLEPGNLDGLEKVRARGKLYREA